MSRFWVAYNRYALDTLSVATFGQGAEKPTTAKAVTLSKASYPLPYPRHDTHDTLQPCCSALLCSLLVRRPLFTKILTGIVGTTASDVIAQLTAHKMGTPTKVTTPPGPARSAKEKPTFR
jgi:hypothetical protein